LHCRVLQALALTLSRGNANDAEKKMSPGIYSRVQDSVAVTCREPAARRSVSERVDVDAKRCRAPTSRRTLSWNPTKRRQFIGNLAGLWFRDRARVAGSALRRRIRGGERVSPCGCRDDATSAESRNEGGRTVKYHLVTDIGALQAPSETMRRDKSTRTLHLEADEPHAV
jgi:hypothetical protein